MWCCHRGSAIENRIGEVAGALGRFGIEHIKTCNGIFFRLVLQ